jgi:hypothetical protein
MKRNPWDALPGQFRAAGEGPMGIHQGKPVWTLEAAEDRRKALSEHNPRTWVEVFQDNAWKRHGDVTITPDPEVKP